MAETRRAANQPSIPVHFVRAMLRHAVAKGLDPAELLRRNRVSPRLLREADARVSLERYADLQVAIMLAMEDECLGYGPAPLPVGSWHMMCHAVIHCDTLGKALARYCRFFGLFHGERGLRLAREGELVCARMGAACEAFLAELLLFNCHRFMSWLVAEHVPVHCFRFRHPRPPHAGEYRPMFLANPVRFGQEHTEMALNRALLDKPVVQGAESLGRFLRHPVLALLTARHERASWTAKVKEILRRDLAELAALDAVASELDIHPQTLRRRLHGEGASFSGIKGQLRRDTALYYLGKRGLSIEEIAHRSGFSESSAFIRAFKGWTGVTPYSYRKGL